MALRLPASAALCAASVLDAGPPVGQYQGHGHGQGHGGAVASTLTAASRGGGTEGSGDYGSGSGRAAPSFGGLGEAPLFNADDDMALLEEVPARFRSLQRNAVADEIASLEQPLDMLRIEGRIEDYFRVSERLGHHLGAHLVTNYEGFMNGMQHVQQVDLEFSLIRVMIANSRRRLTNASSGIGQGGLYVARQRRRRKRLECVQALAVELRLLLEERVTMEKFVEAEKYHDALRINGRLLHELRSERFEGRGLGSGASNLFGRLREDLRRQLEDLKQTLRERSMRQALEAEVDFDAARFEEVLEATAAFGIPSGSATAAAAPGTGSRGGYGYPTGGYAPVAATLHV